VRCAGHERRQMREKSATGCMESEAIFMPPVGMNEAVVVAHT